ncbi:hypothetical protein PENTCL1PPCAC_25016 [Pristionchus entomophagus]|uniref:Arrestin C-terminal-like domain-containing protein n=1 Tax=Pristionchus entomophagus TaxID=358040 RepID=A0AAV5U7U7_9BILA|nr:hypothetical protein PENTCL1PPCAC_25016 [Pristionchus entomophagus]
MGEVYVAYDKQQYAPGDTVSARISVCVWGSPLKICSIRCSVLGIALVKWEESQSNGKTNTTKHYSSTHTYLSLSHYLLLPPDEKKSMYLPIGTHNFQYKFVLPLTCDSTYQNGYGKIKYKCMVEVVRAIFRCNIRAKERFFVYRQVDLRALYFVPTPVIETKETFFLPLNKGSFTMKGVIHDACYLPGQTIHLEASIYNRSPRTISWIEVRLVEVTIFTAFYGTTPYQRVMKNRLVNSQDHLHVAPGSDYFYARNISIPQFNPTHNTCPYITVKYYVKVLISTSSCFGTKLAVKIPVVIGTIPVSHYNPSRTILPSPQLAERTKSVESSDALFNSCSESDAPEYSKFNDRSRLLTVD